MLHSWHSHGETVRALQAFKWQCHMAKSQNSQKLRKTKKKQEKTKKIKENQGKTKEKTEPLKNAKPLKK